MRTVSGHDRSPRWAVATPCSCNAACIRLSVRPSPLSGRSSKRPPRRLRQGDHGQAIDHEGCSASRPAGNPIAPQRGRTSPVRRRTRRSTVSRLTPTICATSRRVTNRSGWRAKFATGYRVRGFLRGFFVRSPAPLCGSMRLNAIRTRSRKTRQSGPFLSWERLDSNQRRHTPTGLQPVPFSLSGTLPAHAAAEAAARKS